MSTEELRGHVPDLNENKHRPLIFEPVQNGHILTLNTISDAAEEAGMEHTPHYSLRDFRTFQARHEANGNNASFIAVTADGSQSKIGYMLANFAQNGLYVPNWNILPGLPQQWTDVILREMLGSILRISRCKEIRQVHFLQHAEKETTGLLDPKIDRWLEQNDYSVSVVRNRTYEFEHKLYRLLHVSPSVKDKLFPHD